MNLTNMLLLVIIAILIRQFYPDFGNGIVVLGFAGGLLYSGYWLIARYPEHRQKERATRQQQEADEREFWEYHKKREAIRDKYDPRREWNEATSVPTEYLKEIHNLNLSHKDMLIRRNGCTSSDFVDEL